MMHGTINIKSALSDSYFGLETDDYVQLSFSKVDAKVAAAAFLDIPQQGRGDFHGFVSNFPAISTCFLVSTLSNTVVVIITALITS